MSEISCKLCGSGHVDVIYDGKIRYGGVGTWTKDDVKMYECHDCGVIWHEDVFDDISSFYVSPEYREAVTGNADAKKFYEVHDGEAQNNFRMTGTKIFRGKIVADIGCAAGAWLDFLKGVASEIVAVEPSLAYREAMREKWGGGGAIFQYAEDAKKDYAGKIDVITSFDVIEHVSDPLRFLRDIYELLSKDGTAIIGTPTRTPVTRALLGEVYEKIVLYTAQHLWIFSEDSLRLLSKKAGFSDFSVRYFQKWDITNLLAWLQYRRPMSIGSEDWNTKSSISYDFVTPTLNEVYKKTLEEHSLADYIAVYLRK